MNNSDDNISCLALCSCQWRKKSVLRWKSYRKEGAFILLYYIRDMSDREISELYHISRSAVGYARNKGLKRLEELMTERSWTAAKDYGYSPFELICRASARDETAIQEILIYRIEKLRFVKRSRQLWKYRKKKLI